MTLAVLWYVMVRAPGFIYWPIAALVMIASVVLLILGGSKTFVLYGVLALAGAYTVFVMPGRVFVESYRTRARDNPPGEYRSEFSEVVFGVRGPTGRRRIAYSDVISIEAHRTFVLLRLVDEANQLVMFSSALIPPAEVARIQTKLRP
ncbi:MAG TPA: hypothetical protein VN133_03630 [Humibacter sp.]|nr:hypothetical protein [Humibacter sp.]